MAKAKKPTPLIMIRLSNSIRVKFLSKMELDKYIETISIDKSHDNYGETVAKTRYLCPDCMEDLYNKGIDQFTCPECDVVFN